METNTLGIPCVPLQEIVESGLAPRCSALNEDWKFFETLKSFKIFLMTLVLYVETSYLGSILANPGEHQTLSNFEHIVFEMPLT